VSDREVWTEVDGYIDELFVKSDATLAAALEASRAAGLPAINVSPAQGKLLYLLALSLRAQHILEVGTLGGYSTIWMARALPATGELITLELEHRHAEVARANFERAGVSELIEIRVGPAIESLPKLEKEGCGPFDLIFIDADKAGNADYFNCALTLSHVGTVIVIDNVVRGGAVIDADSDDPAVVGTRRFNELAASDPRVAVTEIQTVGSKGYDGFALAVVLLSERRAQPRPAEDD